jgi:hypothetical protein
MKIRDYDREGGGGGWWMTARHDSAILCSVGDGRGASSGSNFCPPGSTFSTFGFVAFILISIQVNKKNKKNKHTVQREFCTVDKVIMCVYWHSITWKIFKVQETCLHVLYINNVKTIFEI